MLSFPLILQKSNFHSTRSLNNHHQQYHQQQCADRCVCSLYGNSLHKKKDSKKKSTSYHIHNCLYCHFQQKIYFNRKKRFYFYFHIKKYQISERKNCWAVERKEFNDLHDYFVVFFLKIWRKYVRQDDADGMIKRNE